MAGITAGRRDIALQDRPQVRLLLIRSLGSRRIRAGQIAAGKVGCDLHTGTEQIRESVYQIVLGLKEEDWHPIGSNQPLIAGSKPNQWLTCQDRMATQFRNDFRDPR